MMCQGDNGIDLSLRQRLIDSGRQPGYPAAKQVVVEVKSLGKGQRR